METDEVKTFPNISDFVVPGEEIRVPEKAEKDIIEAMTAFESKGIQEEAEAIQEAKRIILD